MIVPLLAVASLPWVPRTRAPQEGQETARVTVKTGLLPAERALTELSKASGLDLRTSPTTADLPLMIRVDGQETKIVLARIADVLGAEWKPDGNGYVLSSDSAFRRKLAKTPDVRRVARIEAGLTKAEATTRDLRFDDAFAERVRKDGEGLMTKMMGAATGGGKGFDPSSILRSSMLTETPGAQAINGILARIGAENLATLPHGVRVIYALTPTRMQASLPVGARPILDRFARASAEYAQAMKNTGKGEEFDLFSMMGGLGGTPKGKGSVADAHLELWSTDRTITAQLKLYDANGESLGQGFAFLDVSPPAPAKSEGGTPLVVSTLGREWAARYGVASAGIIDPRDGIGAMGAMFGGTGPDPIVARPLSTELRAMLADPVASPPAAPLFDPVAAAISGDLIATVPDSGLARLASLVRKPETTTIEALATIEASPEFSVVREGTLTVIGAATPARLRDEFADRKALRTLVNALFSTGYLRLDDAARYAVAQREELGARHLAAPIAAILGGKAPFGFTGDPLVTEFQTLRIYGSLTDAQRTVLASGRGIPYTALTNDAADALGRILFDSPIGPFPTGNDGEVDGGSFASLLGSGSRRESERTVRFADGVPREGFFTLMTTKSPTYRATDSNTGVATFTDATTLGFMRGAKDVPMLRTFLPAGEYDRFTPATASTLAFKFVFGPRLASLRNLQDYDVTSTAKLTYDQLPSEFRTQVDTMAKTAAMMKAPPAQIKP